MRQIRKYTWVYLLVMVSSVCGIVAWQRSSPLAISVVVKPESAVIGDVLTFTFSVSNTSDQPLRDVLIRVRVPVGTEMDRAEADEDRWAVSLPAAEAENVVMYRAKEELAPDESALLVLVVLVREASEGVIVLDEYTATAEEFSAPVAGAPISVEVSVPLTPTSQPVPSSTGTSTPTVQPTSSPTSTLQPTPSPTSTLQPTPSPTSTLQPSPLPTETATRPTMTPSPTITVVAGELPPTPVPSPTPNLSPEQVRVGTVTVSIFVAIVITIIVLSVIWIVRTSKSSPSDDRER